MVKLRIIAAFMLAALFAVSTQLAVLQVHAAEAPEIVDETWTVLEDDYMDSFGWLALSAEPPLGFEGIICLELFSHVTGREVLQLSSMDDYIGGSWLPEGTYTVTDAYVLGSDHFLVECSGTEAVISNAEDAALTLTLVESVALEATLESISESFEPSVPTMPSETTESTMAMEPDRTASETRLQETFSESDPEEDGASIREVLILRMTLILILLVLCCILFFWYKWYQKHTDIED